MPIAPPSSATPKKASQSLSFKCFKEENLLIKNGVNKTATIELSISTTRGTGKLYSEGRKTIPSTAQSDAAITTSNGSNNFERPSDIFSSIKFYLKCFLGMEALLI